jgi:fructose-bisphosphate aldolase, class I
MNTYNELQSTIADLVVKGKGILAADESAPTIAKRFKAVNLESTEENRCAYRSMLLETPNIGDYISGVILFEESLTHTTTDGIPLPQLAAQQGIVPGIKVDKGFLPLAGAAGDNITQGLDGLAERLATYKQQGARFCQMARGLCYQRNESNSFGYRSQC